MYKFSAPNLLQGTVAAVKEGAVNGVVSIETPAGFVKADVSMAAIRELGLREGTHAAALINAPDSKWGRASASPSRRATGSSVKWLVSSAVP